MDTDYPDLARQFRELTDAALLARWRADTLTELARRVARAEIRSRGLELPTGELAVPENLEVAGDYQVIARFLNPTDAYLIRSCLEMAGVPAIVADAQLMQTNSLWAAALGGARLMVPASHVGEAKEVIAAFERGDFALPDDDEPAEPR